MHDLKACAFCDYCLESVSTSEFRPQNQNLISEIAIFCSIHSFLTLAEGLNDAAPTFPLLAESVDSGTAPVPQEPHLVMQ